MLTGSTTNLKNKGPHFSQAADIPLVCSDPRAWALKALAPRGDLQSQTSVHASGLWEANQSLWRNLSMGRTCRPHPESRDIPAWSSPSARCRLSGTFCHKRQLGLILWLLHKHGSTRSLTLSDRSEPCSLDLLLWPLALPKCHFGRVIYCCLPCCQGGMSHVSDWPGAAKLGKLVQW